MATAAEKQQLIESHIRESGRGPSYAALVEGPSVWIIVQSLQLNGGDVAETAAAYDVPVTAVEAASAYYEAHREHIDAAILLQQA